MNIYNNKNAQHPNEFRQCQNTKIKRKKYEKFLNLQQDLFFMKKFVNNP